MKLKKSEEIQLINTLKNMRITNKKKRHILRNIQSGAKVVNYSENDRKEQTRLFKYRRSFNLNISRRCRFSAYYDGDNCSPTRAYHSDSETVVRKDKDTTYRSQSNLNYDNDSNCAIVFPNPPPSVDEQSDYLSSESSYPIFRNESRCISTGIYDTSHSEIQIKRFSLRESSTSLFGSNSIAASKVTNLERSPSLQHILCSSTDASPCFRTPMSTISGNCDQLTATTTSSRVSCSSGFSHSGVFNTGYNSDDYNLIDCRQRVSNNESTVTRRDSYSTWINNANNRTNSSFQPHSLSSTDDISRKQTQNAISYDNSAIMDDLSSYMDLMIHIPKMHL